MDTQNLNNMPNKEGAVNKSDKMKKIVSESAKFSAAAGVGIVGTMAANAMNDTKDSIEEVQVEPQHQIIDEVVEDAHEATEVFNPNDIIIEDDVEEIVVEESQQNFGTLEESDKQDLAAVEELQPITGENIVDGNAVDGMGIEFVDIDDSEVLLCGEPQYDPLEGIIDDPELEYLDPNENSDNLLASEDLSDPDVLGDILA